MSVWRQLTRGLRTLWNRDAADRDTADEVQDFLDRATADHAARGLSPEQARRAARLELGNVTAVREQVRDAGWEAVVETFVADLRFGARRLARAPGFTAVTVLTLALGIGATTAIYSAVDPVLFEPLPYPGAGRILAITDYGTGGTPLDVTFGTYRELAQRSRSFAALAVFKPWLPTLTGPAEPERLNGQRVSADYFRVLGVPPALGRDFDPADDRPQGGQVAIVSDRLWRRRLGADRGVLGRAVSLDGNLFTIIGVLPRTLDNVLAPSAEIWGLLQYDPAPSSFDTREWGHHLRMVGRVRAGVPVDQARREIAAISAAPAPDFARPPWAALRQGLQVTRLQDDVTRGVRPALLSMLGAVVLVLLIACGNVTNLLLARGAERRGEFALRTALGAGGGRLMRQLLTESLLLAVVGGLGGLVVAGLGVRALLALSPTDLPRIDAIHLGGSAFGFALGLTTTIGLLVGLVPALHASREDLHSVLQDASRRTSRGGGHHLTRRGLVVAEVSLALVLLVGAGLLVHSLRRLLALPTGFNPSGVLTMEVQVAGPRFGPDSVTNRFFAEALEAVRQVPGVSEAAFTSQLPLTGNLPDEYGVNVEATTGNAQQGDPALRYVVTPAYFATMGIQLESGRLLDRSDATGPPAVVISEAFAKRAFPGVNPLGRRVRVGPDTTWKSVVGVVGDVKQSSLIANPQVAFYTVPAQWVWADQSRWLVVRMRGTGSAIVQPVPAIKRAIWSVDKDQPIVRVAPMDAWVAAATAVRRFAMLVFEVFALVALTLAGVGIYGILSGAVAEREREIGVRSALGASRASILALVVRQGIVLTVMGAAIGLVAALVASRAIVALLYGVSRLDPLTYAAVVVLLLGVSALACWVPAWRAVRVDPVIALRAE